MWVIVGLDTPGYHELGAEGILERHPLFRNFEPDGSVSGYGIGKPGRLYQKILRSRQGTLSADEQKQMMTPVELGSWTTVVLQAAEKSLHQGTRNLDGTVQGVEIDITQLIRAKLGAGAERYL